MKKALLVVSFGTSYEETRKKTIEVCEKKLCEAFEAYTFFRAYTSPTIIKKLATRDGMIVDSPKDALEKIHRQGFEEVRVQSLHILCGEEYEKLAEVVEHFGSQFKTITLGKPLLTTREDYEQVINLLEKESPRLGEKEAILWMGHGTKHEAFPAYCALEHMFRARGVSAYVGTVEGYPTFEQVCEALLRERIKKVYLIPFMLVVGDHVQHDMASDAPHSWKMRLRELKIECEVVLKGLGEYPGIQALFVAHGKTI